MLSGRNNRQKRKNDPLKLLWGPSRGQKRKNQGSKLLFRQKSRPKRKIRGSKLRFQLATRFSCSKSSWMDQKLENEITPHRLDRKVTYANIG